MGPALGVLLGTKDGETDGAALGDLEGPSEVAKLGALLGSKDGEADGEHAPALGTNSAHPTPNRTFAP